MTNYDDEVFMSDLEKYMRKNDLTEDDVLRILKGVGEHSWVSKSNFTFEFEDDKAYVEPNEGFNLVLEEVDTNLGYIRLKAVKIQHK